MRQVRFRFQIGSQPIPFCACWRILAVLGCAIYVPAFDAPFVFDSIPRIEQNQDINTVGDANWFHGRRWLAYLSFAIDKSVYGESVWGFHLTSLMIHVVCGLLVYFVGVTLIHRMNERIRRPLEANGVAMIAAIIWFVHPLQTQTVIYHVQRMESLMALFFLAGLVFIGKVRLSQRSTWWWLVPALLAAFASMQCKEVGYMFPFVAAVYVFVLQWDAAHAWSRKMLGVIFVVATIVCAVAIYLFWSSNMMGGGSDWSARIDKSTNYLAAQTTIVPYYLWLLFVPVGQNVDHAWSYLDSYRSAILPGVLLAAGLLAGMILTLRRHPLGVCIVTFFLILAPTSSLLPITDLAVEHRMYLPSFFVILPIVFLLFMVIPNRRWQTMVAVALIVSLSVTALMRNQVWRTKESLWLDSASKAPLNPRAHNNLAIAYAQNSRFKESIKSFETALELMLSRDLNLDYEDFVSTNELTRRLGTVCWLDGQYELAEKYYRLWLQQDEQPFHFYLDVANQFSGSGRFDAAGDFYAKALSTAADDPSKAFVLVDHGFEALQANQARLGRELLQRSVKLDGNSWKAHNNLGIAIMTTDQDARLARQHFERAVELSKGDAEAVANLQRVNQALSAEQHQ